MTLFNNMLMILKILIICGILLMSGFGNVYAGHIQDAKCPHGDHQCHMHKHSFMKTHMNMYYELLAEKYAPDQVEVWQGIVKERETMRKKLKDAKDNGVLLHGEAKTRDWFNEHHELQKKFAKAVKKRKEKEIQKLLPEIFAHHQKLNDLYKETLKMLEQ